VGFAQARSFSDFERDRSHSVLFMVQEVSAVGGGNRQIAPIQDIARLGERAPDDPVVFREGGETRYGNLVPFGLDSNGNEWCFIIVPDQPGNEYEVAYLHTAPGGKLYGRLRGGFAEWLSILVHAPQDEIIRTLYDDDVIYDGLGLG
jgi:hypothetical protein